MQFRAIEFYALTSFPFLVMPDVYGRWTCRYRVQWTGEGQKLPLQGLWRAVQGSWKAAHVPELPVWKCRRSL